MSSLAAPGRVAIVGKDAGREGAVVGADAHRAAQPLALVHQRLKELRGRSSTTYSQGPNVVRKLIK